MTQSGRTFKQEEMQPDPVQATQVEEDLADQQQASFDRLEEVEQLAAGMAHHLNNVFQSILGYTELAELKADDPIALQHYLERIINHTQEGASLIRQLLDYSGQATAEQHLVNLVSTVLETASELKTILSQNITLQVIIQDKPENYQAKADPAKIKRALTNLCLNARDAMPNGGTLELGLTLFDLKAGDQPPCPEMPPGCYIALFVSDTGSGIAPEVIPHVFEPFFTTREVGEGAGLGLAQVYGIVKQHHGYITVTSRPEEKTTFTFYLPAQAVPEKRLPGRKSATSPDKGLNGYFWRSAA